MKRWGKHFYFLLAVFWILGLSGCGESITVAIDGAEVQTTEVEEEHWISGEGLQEFCAAKRRQNDWQFGNELGAVSVITGYENGGERRNRHTR